VVDGISKLPAVDAHDQALSYEDAAVLLGTSARTVSALIAAGFLEPLGENKRRIANGAIARFNEKFTFTAEVAHRLKIEPYQVRVALARRSIEPACALRFGKYLLWRRAEVFDGAETAGNANQPMTYREAARLLGTFEQMVSWLVAAGFLETTGEQYIKITNAAVARFTEQFILTSEIARHLKIQPSHVRMALAQRGIEPVRALNRGRNLVWRRAEVFGSNRSVGRITTTVQAVETHDVGVSYREAALFLGTSAPTVNWLVAAGLLETSGEHDRRITTDSIDRFNEEFAFTMEIARRLAVHPSSVRRVMEEKGIVPICALRCGMRLVWRRSMLDLQSLPPSHTRCVSQP
jgi:Mn-dependent DtxR family transcriptional regulator